MKNNEKDVDFSLTSDKDMLNIQSAIDSNIPVEEPTTIELTENRDNSSKQNSQKVQDLIPHMASDSNLLISRYEISESLKNITSLADRYKDLIPSMASDNHLLGARYEIPESLKNITSLSGRYKDLMTSMASDSNLLPSRYKIPEGLKNITSLSGRYKVLMTSMASDSSLLPSRYKIPEGLKNITSLAGRYKDLIPSMASDSSLLPSRYKIPEGLKNITSLAGRYKDLIPSMASDNHMLASRYEIPENLKNITSLANIYKNLIPSMVSDNHLLASRYEMSGSLKNITSLADRYKDLMPASIKTLAFSFDTEKSNPSTLKALHNSVNDYLGNISSHDLNSIIDLAKKYSSTSEGAAYIATNTTEFTSIEPDAITKLEEMKSKNRYVKKFRELPLPLQLVIYYIIMHIFAPIIEDTLKAATLELYTKASSVIIKSLPANPYIRELISANKENTDLEMLKQLRIITAHNVRLREKPSMKSEVIVCLDKYDVVSVLDKNDRKWLYVQVLIDGKYVNGWVNRTYTKKLHKD